MFRYIDELTDAYGWDLIEKMTASELITAVADLGLTPSAVAAPTAGKPRK